jgi:hypothetical protein
MRTTHLALATVLVLGLCLQMHAQPTEPPPWRWGAQVDETAFEPGGEAVVLHVDAAAQAGRDGSAAAPFNSMAPAVEQAVARRSLLDEEDRDPVGKLELPVWLRLVRRGDRLTAASAPDVNGRPGQWEERASADVPMAGEDYLGFYTQAHGEIAAQSVMSNVTVNGQTVMDWQIAKIGPASGEFNVDGNTIRFKATGGTP